MFSCFARKVSFCKSFERHHQVHPAEAQVDHLVEARVVHPVEAQVDHHVEARVVRLVQVLVDHPVEARAVHHVEARVVHPAEAQVDHHVEAQVDRLALVDHLAEVDDREAKNCRFQMPKLPFYITSCVPIVQINISNQKSDFLDRLIY